MSNAVKPRCGQSPNHPAPDKARIDSSRDGHCGLLAGAGLYNFDRFTVHLPSQRILLDK